MGKRTLARNISYNIINQIIALIVPLISAPYVARIFNAELIGSYSYVLANSSYFVLLENLGFTLYGQIKIASVQDDLGERSRIFKEIYTLKWILMIISLILYGFVILSIDGTLTKRLGAIMFLNIIANGIDVTWFFNGLELFKTTAVRNIIVRVISLIFVLLLVKNAEDIYLYAIIMQGATLSAYLLVLPLVKKYIVFNGSKNLCLKKHIKPALVYFIPGLVTTIFSSTDKTMLGTMCSNYEVGVYEQANKIAQICMGAISAIGNVLMPRATYLYHHENNSDNANNLLYKSLKIVLFISVPVAFGISAISDEFIPFFFGPGYEKSSFLLNILSFNVAFTAWSNLIGQQCLISRDKQGKYNKAVIISAILNVIFNFFLIKGFQSEGAAHASVVASIGNLAMIIWMCRDELCIKKIFKGLFKYMLASIIMYIVVRKICYWKAGTVYSLFVHILIGIVIYMLTVQIINFLKCGEKNDI